MFEVKFSSQMVKPGRQDRPHSRSVCQVPCTSSIDSALHSLSLDRPVHTKPCLEIPSRSWSAFVVNFKSLSITSSCRLVLLVSKVGGGLPRGMGCVTWADKGLLLLFTPVLPNVVELFTAEVWEQSQHYYRCYLGWLSVNNFANCMDTLEKVSQWSFGE